LGVIREAEEVTVALLHVLVVALVEKAVEKAVVELRLALMLQSYPWSGHLALPCTAAAALE
jgi:hypothetical protein